MDTPPDDGFFDQVTFKGAMDTTNWMAGWSILSDNGVIAGDVYGEVIPAEITADTTLSASTYLMTNQVFVTDGVTLTIAPGTTIYAYRDDGGWQPVVHPTQTETKRLPRWSSSRAPRSWLRTEAAPITFTSAADPSALPSVDSGAVSSCSARPLSDGPTDQIEGLPAGVKSTYGGSNDVDNSGVMQYVRIWYGGSVVGSNNEINGLTLGGVGSGTTLDHIDIAYNLDDGIEFFGGTVNVKYLSATTAVMTPSTPTRATRARSNSHLSSSTETVITVPRWTPRSARRLARSLNCVGSVCRIPAERSKLCVLG